MRSICDLAYTGEKMRHFILIGLLLLLSACSENPKDPCEDDLNNCSLITSSWGLESLNQDCMKLAKCMNMEFEILQFTNQPHNSYACSIWKQELKYKKAHYYYPQAEISFGKVSYSRLTEAITTCEMMTGTGSKSLKYYQDLEALFDKMDKSKKATPTPKPIIKIRVIQ
jgi:hypothetical protein